MFWQTVANETQSNNGTARKFASGQNAAGEEIPEVSIAEGAGYPEVATATFSSPLSGAAPFGAGDLVANAAAAIAVTPMQFMVARKNGGGFSLERLRLKKSGTTITNATFRMHFYKSLPVCTNGDNAAWLTTEATYLGAMDVVIDKVFSDGSKGIGMANVGAAIRGTCEADKTYIYGLLEARLAYSEVNSEAWTAAVEHFRF